MVMLQTLSCEDENVFQKSYFVLHFERWNDVSHEPIHLVNQAASFWNFALDCFI